MPKRGQIYFSCSKVGWLGRIGVREINLFHSYGSIKYLIK